MPTGWVVTFAADDIIRIATPKGDIELSKFHLWVDKSGQDCPSIDIDTMRLLADTSDLLALVGAENAAKRMLGWTGQVAA